MRIISSNVRTSKPNRGGSAPSIATFTSGIRRSTARPPRLWLPQHVKWTPPAVGGRASQAAVGSLMGSVWCPPPKQNRVLSGLRKENKSRLGCKRNLPNPTKMYRLATDGPVVSAPRTSSRRLGVRSSTMQ